MDASSVRVTSVPAIRRVAAVEAVIAPVTVGGMRIVIDVTSAAASRGGALLVEHRDRLVDGPDDPLLERALGVADGIAPALRARGLDRQAQDLPGVHLVARGCAHPSPQLVARPSARR